MSEIDDYDVVSSATGWDRVFVRKRDGTEGVRWLQLLGGVLFCWLCTHGLYLYIGTATPLAKIALIATGIVSFAVGAYLFLRLLVVLAVLVLVAIVAAVVYAASLWVFQTAENDIGEFINASICREYQQNFYPYASGGTVHTKTQKQEA